MPRTGRPRAFNREEAVTAAMNLFWEHGFESTSLSRLRAAMGNISAASFYAAFDSKGALFREAVDRYISIYGQVSNSFRDTSLTSKAAIEQGLRQSARMQTENSHPLGCLLVLSAVNCSPEQLHIQEILAKEREKVHGWLKNCIERAVAGFNRYPHAADVIRNISPRDFDSSPRRCSIRNDGCCHHSTDERMGCNINY